jgi:hypothetical protein
MIPPLGVTGSMVAYTPLPHAPAVPYWVIGSEGRCCSIVRTPECSFLNSANIIYNHLTTRQIRNAVNVLSERCHMSNEMRGESLYTYIGYFLQAITFQNGLVQLGSLWQQQNNTIGPQSELGCRPPAPSCDHHPTYSNQQAGLT